MDPALFDQLQHSGSTQAIPRAAWPPELMKMRNLTGLYGYVHAPQAVSSDGTTMPNVVGALEAIREGEPGQSPIKTYRYYFGIHDDGKPYWTGPFRDTPHGHHRDDRPPWATNG
jgi:hypothetical protein